MMSHASLPFAKRSAPRRWLTVSRRPLRSWLPTALTPSLLLPWMLPPGWWQLGAAEAAMPPVNSFDPPHFSVSQPVVIVMLGVGTLLGAGILVLTFVEKLQNVVKKPVAAAATTVAIQAHAASFDREEGGSGGGGGGSKQAVIDVSGFVASKDFELHKEATERRARGLEEQISAIRHEWREQIQPVLSNIEARDEVAQEWRQEVGKKVDDSALKLAAVQKQADMIQATQHNMDTKLDRLIERHIPGRA